MSHRLTRVLVGALAIAAAVFVGTAHASPPGGLPNQSSPVAHDHSEHSHGPDGLDLDPRGKSRDKSGAPAATYSVDEHEPWQNCEYDNSAPVTDAADFSTLPQVHAVYVYPADGVSRFSTFDAMFQADARQSSRLLQTLGRDVRWDFRSTAGNFRSCLTGERRVLDITVFRSQYTAAQLAEPGPPSVFSKIADEMIASPLFSNPNKKYIAWLEASPPYCGQGTLWQDANRSTSNLTEVTRTIGLIYRPYPNDALTGGFCRGRTLLHELGHNLGAAQTVAPNTFDGAHCDDDNNDTMCYTGVAADQISSPTPQFDSGKDDYWDPGASKVTPANPDGVPGPGEKLPWWTLNLSKYTCPLSLTSTPNCGAANSNPGY